MTTLSFGRFRKRSIPEHNVETRRGLYGVRRKGALGAPPSKPTAACPSRILPCAIKLFVTIGGLEWTPLFDDHAKNSAHSHSGSPVNTKPTHRSELAHFAVVLCSETSR